MGIVHGDLVVKNRYEPATFEQIVKVQLLFLAIFYDFAANCTKLTLISLSTAMLTQAYKDEDVQLHVLGTGRRVLREILVLKSETGLNSASWSRRVIARILRKPLLSAATGWGLNLVDYWGKRNLPAGLETFDHFFTLTADEKALAYPLIPYFDASIPGLSDHIDQIISIENVGDMILGFTSFGPQVVRVETNFEDVLKTLDELVEYSLAQNPPRPIIEGYLWNMLQLAIRQEIPHPALLLMGERCIEKIQENPRAWLKTHESFFAVPYLPLAAGIGNYIMLRHIYNQPIKSNSLKKWIERANENDDVEFLFTLVDYELNYVFDTGYMYPAIEVLEMIASSKNINIKVKKAIINLLVRMYFYFPVEIENILSQGKFPEDISKLVQKTSPSDRLDDLLGMRAIGILFDLFLLGPPILREETIYLTKQALQLPNLKSLVSLLIKEMLNLLSGEAIFAVPDDSPSKEIL